MARAALSLPFSELSGSLEDVVVKGQTPGQDAARTRIEWVSRAWAELDEEAFQAWRRWAEASAWRNPRDRGHRGAAGVLPFLRPGREGTRGRPGARPRGGFAPPERIFLGDGVEVEVVGTPSPTVPPSARASLQREPSLVFSSSGANARGVVTELLVQTLASGRCTGTSMSRAASWAFTGPETVEVRLTVGAWACAYRFVRVVTRQETAIVPLGVVTVGG